MTMMVRLFPLNLLMYEGTVSRDFVWRDCLKGFWLQMKGFNHADIFIAFSINLDFLGHFFIWNDDWWWQLSLYLILKQQMKSVNFQILRDIMILYSQTTLSLTRGDCIKTSRYQSFWDIEGKILKTKWLVLTNHLNIPIVFDISVFEITKFNCILNN